MALRAIGRAKKYSDIEQNEEPATCSRHTTMSTSVRAPAAISPHQGHYVTLVARSPALTISTIHTSLAPVHQHNGLVIALGAHSGGFHPGLVGSCGV